MRSTAILTHLHVVEVGFIFLVGAPVVVMGKIFFFQYFLLLFASNESIVAGSERKALYAITAV